MRENPSRGNRETPSLPAAGGVTGRPEKATSRTSGMHGDGKSDGCIVPTKPPNKDGPPTSAEGAEGRRPTEGNALPQAPSRTQSRVDGLGTAHNLSLESGIDFNAGDSSRFPA